ncbi:uncharacterized protein LOC141905184 isoform X2 [Tubulanus polymorphus]|uniref:uncharacterized protein LOC141905184 isoform X2 n=1 Tax=Tubulanus polymorphus TaxID=672921 RepID=UPI003DA22A62
MEDDANLTSRALTDLQLVSETVQAADGKTRRRYDEALKFGNLPCAYTKVMLLGDAGVGKTSTRKILMGEKHETYDGQSTFGIDKHVVNDRFKPVEPDGASELAKAAAHFAIHGKSELLTNVKIPLYLVIIRRLWVALGFVLTFSLGIILFCFQGIEFGFAPVLAIATLATSMLLKNPVTGFNIGNGLAIVLVTVNYLTSVEITAFYAEDNSNEKFVFLIALMCTTCLGFLIGFILATGCGAGISIAVSLMLPPLQTNLKPSINADVVLYLGLGDIVRAGKALLLISFLVIGVLIQSKVDNKKLTITIKAMSVLFALTMINGAVYMNISLEWILFVCAGLAYGIAFIAGQKEGRRMSKIFKIGYVNRCFTDFLGWEVGTILAHFLGWRLSFADLNGTNAMHLALSVIGVALAVSCEIYRWYIATNDAYPVDLVRREIRDNIPGTWPFKYCLLDCAGNELYHVGHHIFMAKHSVYLIVFSLEDAYLRPEWQLERLLYWLNSVFAHARHRDALVFLVGTFKASLEEQQINHIGQWLSNELFATFAGRLALNEKRSRRIPLFAIENRYRIHNVGCPDLDELQRLIKLKVSNAEYASRPIPLKWFAFYDFIVECRALCKNGRPSVISCFFDYHDLFERLKTRCGFEEEAEYFRMLQFFADFGEIFFRPNDARLFRYVILDPKILIDSVEALAGKYASFNDDPYAERARDKLENSGISSKKLLVNILGHVPGATAINIQILQSLELLIPVHRHSADDEYIVPFRLPLDSRNASFHDMNYEKFFYFDFGYFYPEVIFMNLLAKCYTMTRLTTDQDNVRLSEHDIQFFKDSGVFYFGGSVVYRVQLKRPSPSRNIIKISAHKLNEEAETFTVFRQLDAIVNLIRMKDFEYLTYECGFLCHCLVDKDFELDRFHLNVVARHGTTQDWEFPKKGRQKFLCRGEIEEIDFGFPEDKSIDYENEQALAENPTDTKSEDHRPRFEAYISCCRDDRPWVQCELLPVLENAETPFRDVGFFDKPTVAIKVNYVENPNPNMNKLSLLQMSARDIVSCKTAIVVISRDYLIDGRCTRELDYIVKRHKTIIPIIKDGCHVPDSLSTLKVLDYESCRKEGSLLGRFYLPLIYAVKRA